MHFLDKKKFIEKAKKGKLFPVYKEIISDIDTPVSAFLKIRENHENIYLLESVEGNANIGRYSFLGIDTFLTFKAKGNIVYIEQNGKVEEQFSENPVVLLEKIVESLDPCIDFFNALPAFYGGAVGYFGYNTVRYFEKSLLKSEHNVQDKLDVYDLYFIFPKDILIFDKIKNTTTLVANVLVGDDKSLDFEDAYKRISILEEKLISNIQLDLPKHENFDDIDFNSNTTKLEFMNMVETAKKYIYNGDIFQIVLSQRWDLEYKNDDFNIYRSLRAINPSPYMFYLKFKDYSVIGASPEVMVKKVDDRIIVRPLAGTRKRGANDSEDKALEKDLLADTKEISEHMMLLDLGRNDVGRVAKSGTVMVDNYLDIEYYSHVMHIVSQVSGVIDKDVSFSDIFAAVFPAGTVSGAPKIRAMEIIDELEKDKRGIYSGAVAYLGFNKNFDSCITIRTILKKDDRVYIQSGAGIVADSNSESEYFETINKAKAIFEACLRSKFKCDNYSISYDFDKSKISFKKI